MKKLLAVLCLVAVACLSTGCASIVSHQGQGNNHWVVKNTGIGMLGMGLILSSTVYYCPPSGGECVEAEGL